ncbi:MAG TPA: winged helix-turn-helix domain-containing protein [Aliidongia sp.]|nr:winged helix-turn-helix domain-containing protein [Aliidongia sp.]
MRALDILAMLVEAEGELVTKSELMDRVWPNTIVEEHNIQVHVSALRKALGADADWIRTVPRLGYRFVGPTAASPPPSPSLPLNRFFGRESDRAAIQSLLARARLVTLAGPGGIGKTRLGLEIIRAIASDYRDGAFFVDLSSLQEASLVPSLVAAALGIEMESGRPAEQLVHRLRDKHLLILLDNCEQIVDAVAPLAELILAEAPGVSLFSTSREPLACRGEQVYRLPPLPVPNDDVGTAALALASPSIALLVDRVQAADLRFKLTDASTRAAISICRRLDGLPLAIEMVGALAPGLGLEILAEKLEESFSLPYSVSRTAVPRHRSLEATLDWSHALLSPVEQVMFRRMSVFPGQFSLEAAEIVASDDEAPDTQCADLLARLVRKSLISIDPAAAPFSYRMLETIRTYAAEKLEAAGERGLLGARHARLVGDILRQSLEDWDAVPESVWRERYEWVLGCLRASLRWSFGPGGDLTQGLVIVGRSRPLWQALSLDGEGRRWAEMAASSLTEETPGDIAAWVWLAVGYLTRARSFERSISALRRAADLFGVLNDAAERGTALAMLGQMKALAGVPGALQVLTEARVLLEGNTDKRRLGACAIGFGMLYTESGAWAEARREYRLALTLYQVAGATRAVLRVLDNLANVMWAEGALDHAIEAVREVLDLARREQYWAFVGHSSGNLAGILTDRGDLDEALVAAREAMPLCREDEYIDWLLYHLALRVAKAGRPEDAARLWGYADRTARIGAFRQVNERRAVETLATLLRRDLGTTRLEQLVAEGRHIGEEQAIALALA